MKLLVVTNLFPNLAEPQRAKFNESQMLALKELGCEVSVVSPVEWTRRIRYRRIRGTWQLSSGDAWKGIPVMYPTVLSSPKFFRFLNGPLMAISLISSWRKIWRNPPDAVLATWAFPDSYAAVLLRRWYAAPVFIKVHGTDVEHLRGKNSIRRRLTLWALNHCDGVIAVSDYLRQVLVDCGVSSEKITTIRNAVDPLLFFHRDQMECREQLKLDREANIGLFVGNLVELKGLKDLLVALSPAYCAQHQLQFLIIGSGPLEAELRELAKQRGLENEIRFLGSIEHKELPRWMNAASFLCLPSHHEGLPNVVVEALACGTPVVATDVGGIPEIIRSDNGILVPPRDSTALAEAIALLLTKGLPKDKPDAHRTNGYSWSENAASLISMFARAV